MIWQYVSINFLFCWICANIMDYGHPQCGGFCLAVRRAEVQGEVVNGRFKASYFKLLDNKPAIDNKNKKLMFIY